MFYNFIHRCIQYCTILFSIETVSSLVFFLQRDDNAQQDDLSRDSESEAVDEDPIPSPPEHSEREDRLFDLFKSQMSTSLLKNYFDNMPRPVRAHAQSKKARFVSYLESAGLDRLVGNTESISLKTLTSSEQVSGNWSS